MTATTPTPTVSSRFARLSHLDRQKIANLYQSGVRTSILARRYGITPQYLTRTILPEFGFKARKGTPTITLC